MKTITGILVDPLGSPIPNAAIRFTAVKSVGETPESAEATFTTDGSGNYNFTLEEGTYDLHCNVTDVYILSSQVIVDIATPSPITLLDLIKYSTTVVPPVIIPEDPDWVTLHDNVRNGINTVERDKIDQLSNGDHVVAETKKLFENTVINADMAEETVTTSIGVTAVTNQANSYEDANLNQSIQLADLGSTKNASFAFTRELYDASNGQVLFDIKEQFNALTGSYKNNYNFTDTFALTDKETVYGSGSHSETINIDDISSNFSESTLLAEGEYTIERKEDKNVVIEYRDIDNILVNKPKGTIDNDIELTANIHNGRIYESGYILLDKNDELQSSYERGILAYSKLLYERHTNDGFDSKIEKNPDIYDITDEAGTSVFKIDTVNKTVDVAAQLTIANPEDFKGEDGDTIFEVFQFSADNGVTDPWHDGFNETHGDKWRRHATSTNGVIGPWSDGYNLFAEDGADGDTIYFEYSYSSDGTNWHSTFLDGDIWRRERIIENGTPQSGWSAAARIKGSDGADGEITEIAYEYSVDGFEPWHSNFSTGDHYRRERVEYYYTPADRDAIPPTPYLVTPWSTAAKLVPVDGEDYGYKNATVFLYQKTNSQLTPPDAPLGDLTYNFLTLTLTEDQVGNFNGWETSVPSGSDSMWIAVASVWSLTDEDTIPSNEWVIELMSPIGTDGATGVYTSYIYKNAATAPTGNPAGGSYDGTTEVIPTGYTDSPTTPAVGEYTWVRVGKYVHTPATESTPESWDIDTSVYASGWSPSSQFSGTEGLDGDYTSYVYFNNETVPATPTDGSYDGVNETPPTSWTDDPVTPTAPKVTWVSKSRYAQDNNGDWARANGWSTPVKWTGKDAWNTATIMLYKLGTTAPAVPNNVITYSFNDGSLTGSLDGWSTEVPTNTTEGGKVWVTFNTALSQADKDILEIVNWSAPAVMSQNGLNGNDGVGTPGDHGSGSWIINTTLAKATIQGYSNATHTSNFSAAGVANRAPQNKDILSYVNNTATSEEDRFRLDYLYESGTWTAFLSIVDGNQIVHGTIAAHHVIAATFTGDEFNAAFRMIAGSGNAQAGMNGATDGIYNGWRMWAGHATPASAPFRVNSAGKLWATDAVIAGSITVGTTELTETNTINSNTTKSDVGLGNVNNTSDATVLSSAATAANEADKTDGSIAGWTIDASYIWSGTKQTSNAYTSAGITFFKDGALRAKNFRIDTDGSAYFKGDISLATGTLTAANIDAQNISGDVVDVLAKTSIAFSVTTTDKTILSVTAEAESFDRNIVFMGAVVDFVPDDFESGATVKFYLKDGTTIVDTYVLDIDSGSNNYLKALCRPLAGVIPANTAKTFNLTVELAIGSHYKHTAQKIVVQAFKNGSTLS